MLQDRSGPCQVVPHRRNVEAEGFVSLLAVRGFHQSVHPEAEGDRMKVGAGGKWPGVGIGHHRQAFREPLLQVLLGTPCHVVDLP